MQESNIFDKRCQNIEQIQNFKHQLLSRYLLIKKKFHTIFRHLEIFQTKNLQVNKEIMEKR